MLKRFLHDESGVTAIEYGLIAALIFLAIVTAVGTFATNANTMFGKISTAVSNVTG
ncbi:MAG: Flp family type IVb pilin [Terricaulis sp.]